MGGHRLAIQGNSWFVGEAGVFWGQVHFAKGEIEKAREYFVKVRKNSGWRLFRNENPEYRKLVEEKKVRPTMLEVQATVSCLQYPASAKIMPVTHPANFLQAYNLLYLHD